ncbi:type III pantothenate kinase [Cocleimonas sp. KMM 6892]|uniref:type III pantothenate kinase n=1 Tax=unclassified Cocleimonas TaxID=2639732 RepID=UPI002DBD0B0C|nr:MULTISPECIES: type III pantothenate kinase [unclassified Cocleimonas]MEB8431278.1 type III pantothenate kinase [Cocleimonas sp. KMM 6892]MEC4713950.1 type III pantothenate kinase [Cocleimonas sp. KMM 6895]MEC4743281.1 type III pantothenate kinase [Cocleimonas sp. KMM 6896]
MKTLLIDAGNSQLKWAILDDDSLLSEQHSQSHQYELPIEVFEKIVSANTDCDSVIMVSVLGGTFSRAANKITLELQMKFIEITSTNKLGKIENGYKDPTKLGADRFVGILSAYYLNNNSESNKTACIVIDSGTATTIDAIDGNGKHLGGVILPGLKLSSESLLQNTELLGLWGNESNEFIPECFSKETTQAIASGCLLGQAGSIEHICNLMEKRIIEQHENSHEKKQENVEIKRVICGGAAESLLPYMQGEYDLHQDLLMSGLKVIKEELSNNV